MNNFLFLTLLVYSYCNLPVASHNIDMEKIRSSIENIDYYHKKYAKANKGEITLHRNWLFDVALDGIEDEIYYLACYFKDISKYINSWNEYDVFPYEILPKNVNHLCVKLFTPSMDSMLSKCLFEAVKSDEYYLVDEMLKENLTFYMEDRYKRMPHFYVRNIEMLNVFSKYKSFHDNKKKIDYIGQSCLCFWVSIWFPQLIYMNKAQNKEALINDLEDVIITFVNLLTEEEKILLLNADDNSKTSPMNYIKNSKCWSEKVRDLDKNSQRTRGSRKFDLNTGTQIYN